MVQSVELLLDDDLDARVRRQWRALLEAGLPSQGRHTGTSNAPHVTLAVASGVSPDHEDRLADVLTDVDLPLPVLLGGVVVLGRHKHVLARLVVPSTALLDVQARAAGAWSDALEVPPTTASGRWVPHVTLAMHLTDSQVGQALTALRAVPDDPTTSWQGDDGWARAVRRWDSEARETWLVR